MDSEGGHFGRWVGLEGAGGSWMGLGRRKACSWPWTGSYIVGNAYRCSICPWVLRGLMPSAYRNVIARMYYGLGALINHGRRPLGFIIIVIIMNLFLFQLSQ